MRKLITIILILFSAVSYSQKLQNITGYGIQARRIVADTLLGMPKDTFTVPTALNTIPFIAKKGSTVYTWNISLLRWDAVGGSGTVTAASQGLTLNGTTVEFGSATQNASAISSDRYVNMNANSFFGTSRTSYWELSADSSLAGGAAFMRLSGPYGGAINLMSDTAGRTFNSLAWYKQGVFKGELGHDAGPGTNHLYFDSPDDANGFLSYNFEWGGLSHMVFYRTGIGYMAQRGAKRIHIGAATEPGQTLVVTGSQLVTDSVLFTRRIASASATDSVLVRDATGLVKSMAQSSIGMSWENTLDVSSAISTDHAVTGSNTDFVFQTFDDFVFDVDSFYVKNRGYINDTVNQKIVTINKITGAMSLSNWSLTAPTWQQTLTAGSTLTASGLNSVDVNSGEFDLLNAYTLQFGVVGVGAMINFAQSFPNQNIRIRDSISIQPYQGVLNIDTLRGGYIDTTKFKPMAWSPTTGDMVAMNSWAQVSGGGSAALTATYAGYGDGSNVLTGEAAYNYNATTNTLTIDNITTAGAGSTIAMAPASGSAILSLKSSAGAFTTTFTYDASRNFISDYRDGETIRVNGNNVAGITSTGVNINPGGGTAADFTVRSASSNPFVFVDVSADRMGIGITTAAAITHTLTLTGGQRITNVPTGAVTDSIAVFDNGAFEMIAPGDLTGLPYVALTGTSAATGNMVLDLGANDFSLQAGGVVTILDYDNTTDVTVLGDIGTNNAKVTLDEVGKTITTEAVNGYFFNTGVVQMNAYGAGTATFDASGNITSVSDERLKYIQGGYRAGLNELLQINPILYKWRPNSHMETEHTYAGFSAQNVRSVLGEYGSGVNKEGYYSVQDRALIAMLINAVKELNAEIQQLKSR